MASSCVRRRVPRPSGVAAFPKSIRCGVLARLHLRRLHIDLLEEDWYYYKAALKTKRYGLLTIVVNVCEDTEPDWKQAVTHAERILPSVLVREPHIRRAAIPAVRRLLKRYRYRWDGTDGALVAAMQLREVIFAGTRGTELLYLGHEPFHGLDIRLTIGPRLGLRHTAFDG